MSFFKNFVREQVDREMKEKQKILSDLEKAEKLKNELATEVDEHHSAIEHKNNLNLRSSISPQKVRRGSVFSSVCEHYTVSLWVSPGSLSRTTRRSWQQ